MHFPSTLDPTLGFATGLALSLLVVLALELYNSRRITRLSKPIYEYALKRAEDDAARIVEDARKEARRLITEAESASISLTGTHKKENDDAERAYQAALQSMLSSLEARITESAKAAQEAQGRLGATMSADIEKEMQAARARIDSSIAAIEQAHKKRLDDELTQALQSARQEAAEYERARKAAVDTHILALVSETMRITLQRSLPKEVHADLVRAALDEAKASGIF